MEFIYPLLIAFFLIFVSELGDKTQLLVLSFASKLKTYSILLGVAIGSFLSHGIAILFGSFLGNMESVFFHDILEFITYLSFIGIGIFSFLPKKEKKENGSKSKAISSLKIGYVLLIAIGIAVGEIGDKTFLASIGLGIHYPYYKVSLILGAILGMLFSDLIAILLGKFLSKKIPENLISKFSGFLFLLFGIIGLVHFLFAESFFF